MFKSGQSDAASLVPVADPHERNAVPEQPNADVHAITANVGDDTATLGEPGATRDGPAATRLQGIATPLAPGDGAAQITRHPPFPLDQTAPDLYKAMHRAPLAAHGTPHRSSPVPP